MKTSIALLINDLHVSKDNIAEFQANWDEALSICKEDMIDDIVVGGDMFTTRSSQTLSTLMAVKSALTKAVKEGRSVTLAEGNHDCVDLESTIGYNHVFAGLSNISVVDDFEIIEWYNCDFVLIVMSYFPENGSFLYKLEDAVNKAFADYSHIVKSKDNIILYIHEGIHGALGDFEIPTELPVEPFMDFRKVLCGHYHNRIRIKNTPIEYIGASRQHNFGEDENKGYTILYDDGSTQFIQNQANRRYKTYEVDFDELEDLKVDHNPQYKLKIKVKCSDKQAKLFDKQKLIEMGFEKVEVISETPVTRETAATGISEKYDALSLMKEYKAYCEENSIDSRLGIKYLEGANYVETK